MSDHSAVLESNKQAQRGWLRHLKVERSLSTNTLAGYERDTNRYLEWLGDQPVEKVGTEDIEKFVQFLASELNLASSSRARSIAAVRNLHSFLMGEGKLKFDVASEVARPKLPMSVPKALDVEQISKIIESCPNDESASLTQIRDRALLELLYSTGARISEALGLDVDDIDVSEQLILVRGKGAKERIIPIGQPALEALDHYLIRSRPALNSQGIPALFINRRGGRMRRQSAFNVVVAVGEKAGFEQVNPHMFRHSFATHLLDGGADIRVVQELLGHSNVATTQIYTKVSPEHLREAWATSHPRSN